MIWIWRMSYAQMNALYNSSLIARQPTTSKENHLHVGWSADRTTPTPKVHVWHICQRSYWCSYFHQNTNSHKVYRYLEVVLISFIKERYLEYHHFQQDNDPKHTSRWSQNFFEEKSINWWRTPPLSPIENVWGFMKNYLHTHAKPKNTEELRAGIKAFWKTLTPDVCKRYVGHLKRVIPKVIEVDSAPSGF